MQINTLLFFSALPPRFATRLRAWVEAAVPILQERVDGDIYLVYCGESKSFNNLYDFVVRGVDQDPIQVFQIMDPDYSLAQQFGVTLFPALTVIDRNGIVEESGTVFQGVLRNRWADAAPFEEFSSTMPRSSVPV